VQGAAVGAGFGLSMTADFRVATTTTRFSANFARFGFHPGFGLTATLPHAVGRQHALDLFYSGRDLHGAEAVAIGLCAEMVDSPDSLLGRAIDRAAAMATSAPLSLISIRQAFWGQRIEAIELAIAEESTVQKRLASTSDFAEGLRAAAERRPPDFGAK